MNSRCSLFTRNDWSIRFRKRGGGLSFQDKMDESVAASLARVLNLEEYQTIESQYFKAIYIEQLNTLGEDIH